MNLRCFIVGTNDEKSFVLENNKEYVLIDSKEKAKIFFSLYSASLIKASLSKTTEQLCIFNCNEAKTIYRKII